MKIYDITILGGGPTGLFGAFYAGIREASCKIIDSLPALGGRLTAVYPEKFIYDVAGFPKILTQHLVDNLVEQALQYHPTIVLSEAAQTMTKRGDGIIELTTNKGLHLTRALVIAAGVGSYSPKKHTAPGAFELEDRGVSYAVIEKNQYKDKNIVVVGGGDSALDWANEMVSIASSVTLIHRSDKFRAHGDSVTKLQKTSARILLNTEVISFNGMGSLESLSLRNIDTEVLETLPCDAALIMFGFNSSLGRLREWGLDLEKDCIKVNEKMETNIAGIYAAGDITEHPGKLKLIVSGFSEAATAVNFAKNYINPKEKVHPLHSTSIMELKEKRAAKKL